MLLANSAIPIIMKDISFLNFFEGNTENEMEWFPIKLLTGGFNRCGRDWGKSPRSFVNPFCRLYLVTGGGGVVTIGEKDFDLRSGNAYFLPGGILSRNRCYDFMEVYWVHFAPQSLPLEYFLSRYREMRVWPLKELSRWKPVYTGLKNFPLPENSPENYRLQSFLLYLLSDLLEEKPPEDDAPLLRLKNALLFMDREYLRNPPLSVVAAHANMAPNYFHRKFKEVFPGLTPHSYMETKRMRDANALLATGHSLKETAEATGYANVFYFSRSFKKVFGKSPSRSRLEGNS